jgi:hypothetical protein
MKRLNRPSGRFKGWNTTQNLKSEGRQAYVATCCWIHICEVPEEVKLSKREKKLVWWVSEEERN